MARTHDSQNSRWRVSRACVRLSRAGAALRAQALDPIRYTLRFPAPHTHYVEVEAAIPTAGRADVEVYMATWTPGSYLIREYERNVEAVTAAAGTRALAVAKSTQEPLEDHDRRRRRASRCATRSTAAR